MTTTAARSTRVTRSYLQQLLDASAGITPTEESAPTAGQPSTHGEQHPAPAAPVPTHPGVDATAPVVTAAQATTARRSGTRDTAAETAAATAACVSACSDTAPDPTSPAPADWTRFGIVVPVLAGGPGAGASVLAVVLADALAAQGLRVLLVDAADPLRSGLALAATTDGPTTDGPHPGVSIRHAHRGPIRVARLEFTGLPVRSLGMVPAPAYFAPAPAPVTVTATSDKAEEEADEAVDVTVVDLGWDAWTIASQPLQGPGGWLRTGATPPRPVLAVRPTAPGVRAAETLLARLAPWQGHGMAPVAATVLTGCRKPTSTAVAAAGYHLEALLAAAVCLPHDPGVAERGITDTQTPPRLHQAVSPLLGALGLSGPMTTPTPRSVAARLLRRPSQHHERTPS